ncbi:paraneoplastic antigen-like protein 8A isoform X3 [Canis lupus familiaris]|nr:paraneoplastic antigen-like protein 8A isoform X3 [Canis lupus familiaris]|eukprot:XP_022260860.1 paraneoplastic antigen-like protein 8A [Canis lupus familiaris]
MATAGAGARVRKRALRRRPRLRAAAGLEARRRAPRGGRAGPERGRPPASRPGSAGQAARVGRAGAWRAARRGPELPDPSPAAASRARGGRSAVSGRRTRRCQVVATMAMNLLEDWCRGMEVDIHRSLLVTGIPEDCGQAEIEETLNGVLSPLGPYFVLNKIFLREENAKAALIEVGEGVNLRAIPREFPGRGGVWRVVCRDPTQDAEFLKNLNEFLDAEGRTWEDVVRLLQLGHSPRPQNQPRENWAEALGVLLGAVVQIIIYMDAEIRSREEARVQEVADAQAVATSASAARRKIKKEPGRAAEIGSALKIENPDCWHDPGDEGDPPKPVVLRAGAKNRSRRKKQRKNPKQESVPWKKPKGQHSNSSGSLEDLEADGAEDMEVSEYIRSKKKPCVKQEESALKKPMAKCAWKAPSTPSHDPPSEAVSPGVALESDQDGGQEGPPKKKAMSWALAKSSAPMRKKKKVSLGPVSYVLVDSEDAKKKPAIAKKGPGSRRDASVRKALRGPQPEGLPASTSQGPKAKPEGSPPASSGQNGNRSHLGCASKWMSGEEQEQQVGIEALGGMAGQVVREEDPSAAEEADDTPAEASEGESPDLPPRSP